MSRYTISIDKETLEQLRIALQVALPIINTPPPEVPLAFDEVYYLSANPDVRAAVEDKIFRSGYEHYIKHGKDEGRSPTRPSVQWMPQDWYVNEAALTRSLAEATFANGVEVDGRSIFHGFGPVVSFHTWSDGSVRRIS